MFISVIDCRFDYPFNLCDRIGMGFNSLIDSSIQIVEDAVANQVKDVVLCFNVIIN